MPDPRPLLLAMLLAGCATSPVRGPARTELAAPCQLPCQLRQGLFLLRGTIGGDSATFLLDTGTDRMVLDEQFGLRLGLSPDGAGTVRTAAGHELPHGGLVTLPRLQLGDAVFHKVPASLLDLRELSESTGRRIGGILGCDLFSACELELDFPGRRVTVRPRPEAPRSGAIPYSGTIPTVAAMLDGKPLDVLIDTGFQRTLALPPGTAHSWRRPPRPDGELVTVAGAAAKSLGRLAGALHLGEHRWTDPWVTLAPGSAKLGAQALRELVLTLDVAAGLLWLQRR